MKRRLLSAILALCITFTALPAAAHASENPLESVSDEAIVNAEDTHLLDEPDTNDDSMNAQNNELNKTINISKTKAAVQTNINIGNIASGTCGNNGDDVRWSLDSSDGIWATLTISGTGAMQNFYSDAGAPWMDNYRNIIKSVIIEDGITVVGNYAFGYSKNNSAYSCENLANISLPDSVAAIGEGAFQNCSALADLKIPNSVSRIGSRAFASCTNLSNIVIPKGVSTIEDSTFLYCEKLIRLNIPDNITVIKDYAFYGSGLASINIPSSVVSIGYRSLYPISKITVDTENRYYCLEDDILFDKGKTKLVYCPSGKAGTYSIPASVKVIGADSFAESELTKIIIPEGVECIEESAFSYCAGLTDLSIPDSVTSIGVNAFLSCYNLVSITLPKYITKIENGLFERNSCLVQIIIPNNVKSIGEWAFKYCANLENITIPKSVTEISTLAFYGCDNLKDIYYGGDENEWNSIQGIEDLSLKAAIHYNSIESGSGGTATKPSTGENTDTSIKKISIPFYPDGITLNVDWGWDLFNKSAIGNPAVYDSRFTSFATTGLALSSATENSLEKAEKVIQDIGFEQIHSDYYNLDFLSGLYKPGVSFGYKHISNNNKERHIFVIAIRGSTDYQDWFTDFSAGGFVLSAQNVYSKLEEYIRNICHLDINTIKKCSKFFVTGHSLGGATANLAAVLLNNNFGADNVYAYTFASPMNIIGKSAAELNTPNIFNILNLEDGVATNCHPFNNSRYGWDMWFHREIFKSYGFYDNFELLTGRKFNNGGFLGFGSDSAHDVRVYMAYLLSNETQGRVKVIRIACPVDIVITDSNDILMGSIVCNIINNNSEKIYMRVNGDEKYIYLLDNGDYNIKLLATGDGLMQYSVQEMELNTSRIIEQKSFKNTVLINGREMISKVSVWDETNNEINTEDKIAIPNVRLFVLGNDGNIEKEILSDDKGTEIPLIHTVTLNANGGTVSPSVLKTDYTGKLNNLPTPSRTGYSFNGWYSEVNGGIQINTDTIFNQDATIYARWTYNSNSSSGSSSSSGGGYYGGNSSNYVSYYTITFNANGGTVDTSTLKTGTNGKLSSLPAPNRSDYKFDGWYTEIDGGTLITTDTVFNKNTTVYAHWTHIETPSQPTLPDNEPKVPDPVPETPSAAYRRGGKVTDTDSQAIYKITKVAYSNGTGGTVSYVSSTDKKAARIIVPATISLDGVAYKVTKICQNAFKNNLNLKNIVIGKNVETIGNSAFYGCKNLQKATLGSKVQIIWSKAFYKCKSLTKIVIPVKVTTIGKQAFYGCTKLKSITIKTAKLTSGSVGSNAFKGIASKAFVKVPNKALKKYKKLLPVKGVGKKAKIE